MLSYLMEYLRSLEAHHADHTPSFLDHAEGIDCDRLGCLYEKWALDVLPQSKLMSEIITRPLNHFKDDSATLLESPERRIPKNNSGIPVFPTLDLDHEGPEVVRCIINAYLDHLWSEFYFKSFFVNTYLTS